MRYFILAMLLSIGVAHAQSAGTLNLSGPSTGGQIITPTTINNAVNPQFANKVDVTNGSATNLTLTNTSLPTSCSGQPSGRFVNIGGLIDACP